MHHLFVPNLYIQDYTCLPIDELVNRGITALLCDIDNTLVAHDVAEPTEKVIAFLDEIKRAQIKLIFISNNNEDRVKKFCSNLNIPYYSFAKKPLKLTYKKIVIEHNLNKETVAVMGDQLLTDILGGNRMHFFTILTQPLVQRDITYTKINRVIENQVYRYLEKKQLLIKGEFHDSM